MATAGHAKTAFGGDPAAVVGPPGTVAGTVGRHVLRRRRRYNLRPGHLHEDEVAEAWGKITAEDSW